jgi:hypothetical protein
MGVALAVLALVGATHDRPGEPFYPFRVAFEEFTLPGGPARWPAQLQLLDQRWADVSAAARAGDPVALQAAVTAYQADLGDLVGSEDQPGADPAALQHALQGHATSLSDASKDMPDAGASMAASVAGPVIQDQQVVAAPAERLQAPSSPPATTPASGPSASPTKPGNGNGNGNGGGNGNANGGGNGNGNGNGGGNGNNGNGNGNGNGGGNGNGNGNGHGRK